MLVSNHPKLLQYDERYQCCHKNTKVDFYYDLYQNSVSPKEGYEIKYPVQIDTSVCLFFILEKCTSPILQRFQYIRFQKYFTNKPNAETCIHSERSLMNRLENKKTNSGFLIFKNSIKPELGSQIKYSLKHELKQDEM